MLTKNIYSSSLSYFIFLVGLVFFGGSCYENSWCHTYINSLLNLLPALFLPMAPIFIFSLITYKMRDEVFDAWRKFSVWFFLVWFILALFMFSGGSGGGLGGVVDAWLKSILFGALLILYFIISTTLIIKKRAQFKKK